MGQGVQPARWDPSWRRQREVVLRETAGIARADEPVDLRMDFAADAVRDLRRELRVIRVLADGAGERLEEVPSQVYDLSEYHQGLGGTVTFLASVPAHGTARYLVCHDNPDAPAPAYRTDLTVTEPARGLGYAIDTTAFHAELDQASGQLKTFTPLLIGGPPLRTRERPVNVSPDLVAKENLSYVNVRRWNPPATVRVDSGPVVLAIHRSATMDFPGPRGEPGLSKVEVGVTYHFYAGLPYFRQASTIRFLDDVELFSMRNGAEMAWADNPFTIVLWEGHDGETAWVPMDSLDPLTVEDRDLGARAVLPPDLHWIGFLNTEHGGGVAALFLDYRNVSPYRTDNRAPTHNAGFYVFAGPGDNYWFRAPVWEHCVQDPERCAATLIPAGSIYLETNAVLAYNYFADGGVPGISEWGQRLRAPLVAEYEESDARARRWQPADPPPPRPFEESAAGLSRAGG